MADDKTSMDRRGFLKHAATGAVAAAVPSSMLTRSRMITTMTTKLFRPTRRCAPRLLSRFWLRKDSLINLLWML